MDERVRELLDRVRGTALTMGEAAGATARYAAKCAGQTVDIAKLNMKIFDLKTDIKLTVTYDVEEAYKDASFVFAQMRVGKYAMREQDEKIPLRHHIGSVSAPPGERAQRQPGQLAGPFIIHILRRLPEDGCDLLVVALDDHVMELVDMAPGIRIPLLFRIRLCQLADGFPDLGSHPVPTQFICKRD